MPDTPPRSFVDEMNNSPDPLSDLRVDGAAAAEPSTAAEGKGAEPAASPPAAPAPNPELAELRSSIERIERRAFEAEQRAAYFAGEAARGKPAPTPTEPEVKPFQFDRDAFATDMEKDPASAIYHLVNRMQESGINLARKDIERQVDGRLGERERTEQLQTSFRRDAERTKAEFGEFVGVGADNKPLNPEFDHEAYVQAQELAQGRGNPRLADGSFVLSPGDLHTAASLVHAKWLRNGKISTQPKSQAAAPTAAPRSLRQIIDQVPNSDSLGNGATGPRAATKPKSLDDLLGTSMYPSQRDVTAARNYIKRMGWDEARFVQNVLESSRNGEIDF